MKPFRLKYGMAKVLIVEDEIFIQMLLEDMLEEMGHELIGPAATPEEALKLVDSCDIAILDLNLGKGVTSLEVADALQERDIPFAFATGSKADPAMDQYNALSLDKPFDMDCLFEVIDKLISQRQHERPLDH